MDPGVLLETQRIYGTLLRGERAAWLKNSPTLESFEKNLKLSHLGTVLELSSATFSSNV